MSTTSYSFINGRNVLSAVNWSNPLKTRSGFPASLVRIDAFNEPYSYLVRVSEPETAKSYTTWVTPNGKDRVGLDSPGDIINVPEVPKFDYTKPCRTRDGRVAEFVSNANDGRICPLVFHVKGQRRTFKLNGKYYHDEVPTVFDLENYEPVVTPVVPQTTSAVFGKVEPVLDPIKPVQARNGLSARVISTNGKSDRPLIAIVTEKSGRETLYSYGMDGRLHKSVNCARDIINVPPKIEPTHVEVDKMMWVFRRLEDGTLLTISRDPGTAPEVALGRTDKYKFLGSHRVNFTMVIGNRED